MKILLTGSTGLLGNNLLRLFLRLGHQVRVTVRPLTDQRSLSGLDVEVVEFDLASSSLPAGIFDEIDFIVHAAALIQIGWGKLEESRRINVDATQRLAQAARLKKVPMLFVSSVDTLAVSVDGRPISETQFSPSNPSCSYVVSKKEAEVVFEKEIENGLRGVIVNPGFMLGPWDWKPSSGRMVLEVGSRRTPFAPSGGCSVVDVRDVADGVLAVMMNGKFGEKYILAGQNLTYKELWERISKITSTKSPLGIVPPFVANLIGNVADFWHRITGNEPTLNSAAMEMSQLFHWYSSEKAKSEIGYRIGSVDDAIADSWTWFKEFGYTDN